MRAKWKWGAEEKRKGVDGFNNASILTFQSHHINSLIREQFQNSNDAKADGATTVRIRIELCQIERNVIPALDEFERILRLIGKCHPDRAKFFTRARRMLSRPSIPFLVYSDYNTKGLSGDDSDENSSFAACVLSEGRSVKHSKTAGGSYGVGKNAIYSLSAFRTVLYSSLNAKGEHIFQGVGKIASYKQNGINYEGRLYLGLGDDRMSVREPRLIPATFRRKVQGLSQFVMGVELSEDWYQEFAKAILRNYWMLLINGGLEVELLDEGKMILNINRDNAARLLAEEFEKETEEGTLEPYGNPRLFYQSFVNGNVVEFVIPHLGKCRFHYIESEEGENNVAYLRNGMVIFSKIEKRLVGASVTGVFICDTADGNGVLRCMEPPKHDSFEPQMLEENHDNLTRREGDRILREIKANIRAEIKKLIDRYKEEIETPPFLASLFEDLQRGLHLSLKGNRKNEPGDEETFYRMPVEDDISVVMDSSGATEYVASQHGTYELPSAGRSKGTSPSKRTAATKGGKSGGAGGSTGRRQPKLPVSARIFHFGTHGSKNVYKVVILSDQTLGLAELSLTQHGDNGMDVAFELQRVYSDSGVESEFYSVVDRDGFVSEYKLRLEISEGRNEYFLDVAESQKSAFILNG